MTRVTVAGNPTDQSGSLSGVLREWLLAPVLDRLEALMAQTNQQEAAIQASIAGVAQAVAGVEAQVAAAVSELQQLRDQLAAVQEVDLTDEVAQLDAVAGRLSAARDALDAAVPDQPAPPAPPAPPPAP